jgi:uncharacterized membrane protein
MEPDTMNTQPLTEQEIETRAERAIDRLDARFMRGELTREQYDREIGIIDAWTIQQYKEHTA